MPTGIPVATVAIDGAYNAALLAVAILAINDADLRERLVAYRRISPRRPWPGRRSPTRYHSSLMSDIAFEKPDPRDFLDIDSFLRTRKSS